MPGGDYCGGSGNALAETGLVGMTLVGVFVWQITTALKRPVPAGEPWRGAIGALTLAGLAGLFVTGLAEGLHHLRFVWLLTAAGIAMVSGGGDRRGVR